ncbi:MAG: hypothetical protein IT305_17700 [Chloroflexi bacterium]|nr:hypothetical protein [Chloroflexota bacterium]
MSTVGLIRIRATRRIGRHACGEEIDERAPKMTLSLSVRLIITLVGLTSLGVIMPTGAVAQAPCNPRPNVSVQSNVEAGRLRVVAATTTNSGTPTNSLRRIQFTRMDNAQVDTPGRAGVGQPFTMDLPSGTSAFTFHVRRTTNTGGATVHMVIVDACGDWPTFVGGGANALPVNPVPMPTPTPSPSPSPSPAPGGQPIVITGQGPQASARFHLQAGLVTLKAQKSGNFFLFADLLASDGDFIDSVGLSRDETVGMSADRIAVAGEYLIDVGGSGAWTVTIEQPHPTGASPPPVTYRGTKGESLTPFFYLDEGLTILRASQIGTGHLWLTLLDAEGRYVDSVDLSSGESVGAGLDGIEGAGVHFIEVDADGDWSVIVEQPRPKSGPPAPQTFSGPKGEHVSGFIYLQAGLNILRATQSGAGDLWINLVDANGGFEGLFHLDDGVPSGSRAVAIERSGLYLLEIDADGAWTVTVE